MSIKSTVVTDNRINANVSPPSKIVPKQVVLQDVTALHIGLGNVDNTSDINKPISALAQAALDLKANQSTTYTKTEVDAEVIAASTSASSDLTVHADLTNNPHSVTATQVGLGNVDNTSDVNKPVSTATQTALDLKANQSTTYTKTEVDTNIANLVNGAPGTLDTLNELAEALGDDNDYATTTAALIGQKQDTLTFGIANTNAVKMDNTSDAPGGGDIAIFASAGIMPKTFQSLKYDMGIPTLRSDVDQNITDIAGKQDTLTFGIANTNAVKMDNTSAAPGGGDIAIFASTGIMPKTFQSLKYDLGVNDKAPINNPIFTGDLTSDTDTLFVDSTNHRVGIGTTSPDTTLDMDGHFRLLVSPENRVSGQASALIKGTGGRSANLRVVGPVTVTHDLFKNSGDTGGFADNSNHFHTVQKINRITQQSGSGTPNERVQEQYYAIENNNLKNSKAAFWNWHRVSKEVSSTSVSLTNLVGWDVSGIQDSSNRTATSQVLFPTGGAEATTFTFDTAGNNPFALNAVLRITVDIDFEGAIVAATNFAKVTAVSGATATVVLYGGNYKSTDEVADGNSQTAVTTGFSIKKIDTAQYMPLASGTGIDVLSDSTRTTTTDTFKITFASAHGLELNDTVSIITDNTGGFQAAEVAFVKSVGSTTEATFVYGRVFEPESRLALSDIGSSSVVGVLKGTLDGLHRFTAGDQLMHFNADNEGRYKSYQIGPGSEVGADCIAIGKNVYNKDASTIKIGYDNAMLDVRSDGVVVAGDIESSGSITGTTLVGTLSTAAQPNIISVGTLTSATISGDLTVDTNTLKVDSANNRVGIGTATPGAGSILSVAGNSRFNGTITLPSQGKGLVKQKCFFKSGGIRLQHAAATTDEISMRYEGSNPAPEGQNLNSNFVIEQIHGNANKGAIKFIPSTVSPHPNVGESLIRLDGQNVDINPDNLTRLLSDTSVAADKKLTFLDSRTHEHGLRFEHSGNDKVIQMGRYDSYPSATEGDFKITAKSGNNSVQDILTIDQTSNAISLHQSVKIKSRITHEGTTQASFGFTAATPATNVFDITTSNVQRLSVNASGLVTIAGDLQVNGNVGVATAPTSGNHLTNKTYVDAQVAGIVDSAPAALDTLNELAAALGDDASFATTTANSIGEKLAKASNLSDLANAATARTNLGLGTAATTASSDYATPAQVAVNAQSISDVNSDLATTQVEVDTKASKTNNLSDLASAATARTNLGLGNVTDESKATMFASPSFTGTISSSGLLDFGHRTSNDVIIRAESDSHDITLIRAAANVDTVGVSLKYIGSGSGDENLFEIKTDGGGSLKIDNSGDVGINTAPVDGIDLAVGTFTSSGNVGIAGNLTVDTDTLKVDSSNDRVGINKAVPTEALDVVGNISASGTITGNSVIAVNMLQTTGDCEIDGCELGINGGTVSIAGPAEFNDQTEFQEAVEFQDEVDFSAGALIGLSDLDIGSGNFSVDTNVLLANGTLNKVGIKHTPVSASADLHVNGSMIVANSTEKGLSIIPGAYQYSIGDIDGGENGTYLEIDSVNTFARLHGGGLAIGKALTSGKTLDVAGDSLMNNLTVDGTFTASGDCVIENTIELTGGAGIEATGTIETTDTVTAKGYSLNANTFTVVSTTSTLAASTNGLTVILQNTGPINITLPTLAAGHVTTFISETNNAVTFVADTGITVNSFGGNDTTAGIFAQCQVIYKTTTVAFLGGNLV